MAVPTSAYYAVCCENPHICYNFRRFESLADHPSFSPKYTSSPSLFISSNDFRWEVEVEDRGSRNCVPLSVDRTATTLHEPLLPPLLASSSIFTLSDSSPLARCNADDAVADEEYAFGFKEGEGGVAGETEAVAGVEAATAVDDSTALTEGSRSCSP